MKRFFFGLFLSSFFIVACDTSPGKATTAGTDSASHVSIIKTVNDLEPALQKADSLQVIYYDNPDGDSLRYTRYFTYTETKDSTQVKRLVQQLNQVYVQEPKTRPCRSEGKLYLLRGEDILKTLYFSARGDSCRYFYFIRDGAFMYFPVTEDAQKFLQENRRMARKPKATT
jgi:hypothetical protein